MRQRLETEITEIKKNVFVYLINYKSFDLVRKSKARRQKIAFHGQFTPIDILVIKEVYNQKKVILCPYLRIQKIS